MKKSAAPEHATEHLPLISNRFVYMATAMVAFLALLSVAINLGGRKLGAEMALAGHSDSTQDFLVTIGQDHLRLVANTLRFETQRRDGPAERADLYLLWPEMSGYRSELRTRFDDITRSDGLIFIQLSQSTMSRDMSGRVEPIYSHLFDGPAEKGLYGLTLHRLKSDAGYGNEVLLTAPRPGGPDFAVRCLLPAAGTPASSGDCQRDVHVGRDLSVLYRFSSSLLSDWAEIDDAVRRYVTARIDAEPQLPSNSPKIPENPARNDSL
ncbi:hypothetical protein [Ciceribacter thiooxidans]|uniref:Transmembrane anchored protein n=1 Tax=Ciceribacter thiooxidans TaxID=1969821 RepID=A0ABV7HZN3_9HYPH|nr:hypothetical protein [Ciceribacter thiooxidans]